MEKSKNHIKNRINIVLTLDPLDIQIKELVQQKQSKENENTSKMNLY
jgi:hypothetical protein